MSLIPKTEPIRIGLKSSSRSPKKSISSMVSGTSPPKP
jgi:hypothetical protein